MSEPISPDLGPPERLHPLFLLTSLGGSLRQLAGGYAFLAYLVISGQLDTALAVAVALLVIMLAGVFLYWRSFHFRVGGSEIRIDSGILNRTHRSIPFDRVQDVDISQSLVARLLGLASVRFETGGASAGKADEGVLHAIPLQRAEQLRALIRGHKPAGGPAPLAAGGDESALVYAMDSRRLLLAGLFNFSLAIFAGLIGVTQTMGDFLGFNPLHERFWQGLLARTGPLTDFVLTHRAAAVAAGVVLLLLVGAATGIAQTVVREFGFRLHRTETSLRRRRGLFTRTDVSLPLRRVQAAIVATGPVRDAFGWRSLSLQNLAQDEGSGDHVVAPLASEEEVARIITELGWRPVAADVRWRRISPAYVWTFVMVVAPVALIAGLQLALFAGLPPAAPVVAVAGLLSLAVAARVLAWIRTAYALDGDRLLVRTGWWRRRLRILPVAKIQSIDIAESFLSRAFGIANLVFGVAGGRGFSAHNIPAVGREEARQLRDRLLVLAP